MWNEPAPPQASGWQREIKYTAKDYLQLYPKVQELRTRLSSESGEPVSALDVEKVAYVLGKRAALPPPSEGRSRKRKAAANDGSAPVKTKAAPAKKPRLDSSEIEQSVPTSTAGAPINADDFAVAANAAVPKKRKGNAAKKLPADASANALLAPNDATVDGHTASIDAATAAAPDSGHPADSPAQAKPKKAVARKTVTKKLTAKKPSVAADGAEHPAPINSTSDEPAAPTDASAPAKPKRTKAKPPTTSVDSDKPPALTNAKTPAPAKTSRVKKVPIDPTDDMAGKTTAPAKAKRGRAQKPSTDVKDDGPLIVDDTATLIEQKESVD